MTVTLLSPTVDKVNIPKSQFNTLPDYLQSFISGLSHIWKVTVTPHKSADSGLCRVVILAAANYRTGSLVLDNTGRIPTTAPPANEDDLRPICYYVWGGGTQTFQVTQPTNSGYVVSIKETFE